jgi:hypothetical protein
MATSQLANKSEVLEQPDGTREWRLNGKLHREGGPAIEFSDGMREWWLKGTRHREDGPAVEYGDGGRTWWVDNNLHREDGPAVELADGRREWWLDGHQFTKVEHAAAVLRRERHRALEAALATTIRPFVRTRVSDLSC